VKPISQTVDRRGESLEFKQRFIRYVVSFIILLGFIFTFYFWKESKEIPVLDKVESFEMNTVFGEPYNLTNNKVKLLTFFYTRCPDICPMTMFDFKDLQDQLQEEGLFGTEVELLAITLDPQNDTEEIIREYANLFEADSVGWKFMRGESDETKEIADSLKMKYKKMNDDFISHNTTMYLIDQDNNIRSLFNMANSKEPVDKEEIMKTIRIIVHE